MKKFLEVLKWVFSFTKKASLRYLVDANLSLDEFQLLELAYKTQLKKQTKPPTKG